MKKFFVLVFVVILFPIFGISAHAEDIYAETSAAFGADTLDDILSRDEKEIIGELKLDGNYDAGGALARLWRSFLSSLVDEIRKNLDYCTGLIAIALFTAVGGTLCSSKNISNFIEILGCGSTAAFMLGGMNSIVSQTVDALYRLSDYSKAALPVIFTASAASGAVTSSAAKFAAVSFALDVLMSISQKIIIPVIYAYLALTLSSSMFPNPILNGIHKLCKWAAVTMMTGMTLAFTTYISMVGAIGAAVDTSAVKTVRSFISGTLPVVGGMISDASAMVLSAAGVVKNCAGVFGLIAVAVMCTAPFALLSVKMLFLKAVSAISDSMESKRLTSLFSGLGSTMGLLLGLLGSCGIMLFISLTAGMKAVSI